MNATKTSKQFNPICRISNSHIAVVLELEQKRKAVSISKDEALFLAAKALKAWSEYGDSMRKHGRGAECTVAATGYTTEYLLGMIASAK